MKNCPAGAEEGFLLEAFWSLEDLLMVLMLLPFSSIFLFYPHLSPLKNSHNCRVLAGRYLSDAGPR